MAKRRLEGGRALLVVNQGIISFILFKIEVLLRFKGLRSHRSNGQPTSSAHAVGSSLPKRRNEEQRPSRSEDPPDSANLPTATIQLFP